jgi:hypothetical protein
VLVPPLPVLVLVPVLAHCMQGIYYTVQIILIVCSSTLCHDPPMRHFTAFAILGLLTGCAAHTDPAPPSTPEQDPSSYASGSMSPSGAVSTPYPSTTTPRDPGAATAAIDANLDRLKALQIFEVGGLLLSNLPAAANCYGQPCPGQEQQYADAKEAQAHRLADFTDTTVSAAAMPATYDVVTPDVSEQNLGLLRSLNIVAVGGLIVAKPVISGNCYGACPEELAACNAINNDRANKLANIAKAF